MPKEITNKFRQAHQELNEIKTELNRLEKRTLEDEGVLGQDFLTLRRKVSRLEKRLAELEAAKA